MKKNSVQIIKNLKYFYTCMNNEIDFFIIVKLILFKT